MFIKVDSNYFDKLKGVFNKNIVSVLRIFFLLFFFLIFKAVFLMFMLFKWCLKLHFLVANDNDNHFLEFLQLIILFFETKVKLIWIFINHWEITKTVKLTFSLK